MRALRAAEVVIGEVLRVGAGRRIDDGVVVETDCILPKRVLLLLLLLTTAHDPWLLDTASVCDGSSSSSSSSSSLSRVRDRIEHETESRETREEVES
jgi:hypothetical protein